MWVARSDGRLRLSCGCSEGIGGRAVCESPNVRRENLLQRVGALHAASLHPAPDAETLANARRCRGNGVRARRDVRRVTGVCNSRSRCDDSVRLEPYFLPSSVRSASCVVATTMTCRDPRSSADLLGLQWMTSDGNALAPPLSKRQDCSDALTPSASLAPRRPLLPCVVHQTRKRGGASAPVVWRHGGPRGQRDHWCDRCHHG